MECLECGDCCLETEMLLSKKDIDRLEKKGFKSKYFSRQNNEGYVVLKNRKGHCIFLMLNKKDVRFMKIDQWVVDYIL